MKCKLVKKNQMCNEQGMSVYDNHADTYFTSGGDVVVLACYHLMWHHLAKVTTGCLLLLPL